MAAVQLRQHPPQAGARLKKASTGRRGGTKRGTPPRRRRAPKPALVDAPQPPPIAGRWNADPEDVQRSVVKLVLSLVEFLRQLMERQAVRRMEAETLTPEEIEAVGVALMRLEETVRQMASEFGLDPADLNLDLGPLGKLT